MQIYKMSLNAAFHRTFTLQWSINHHAEINTIKIEFSVSLCQQTK
ncbi:hypothetical protein yrohd0001_4110 [Yersinia rohdei ATCC 43380]|nr:hypothetical protein yrohd0001_4110 [Yersinia rohdei ATCC 43380]